MRYPRSDHEWTHRQVTWRAVISWSGLSDFSDANLASYPSAYGPVTTFLGYAPQSNVAGALAASPWPYVGGSDPAFFLAHGQSDATVPYFESSNMAPHASDAGVSTTFVTNSDSIHAGPLFDVNRMDMACGALAFLAANTL